MTDATPLVMPRIQAVQQPENILELLCKPPRWLCWKAGPFKANGNLAKHDSEFPRPIRLSPDVTIWDEREVDAWIERKRAAAAKGP